MEKQIHDLVSVVVPVYNVEPYLDRCVTSIVNQTYTNLEIILVDDGSPDNCPQMCDEWAEKDARIRVIHKENSGVSDARNVGIAHATGEVLAFVDSDDYIDENMYELLVSALQRTDAEMACCGRYNGKNGEETPEYCLKGETVFPSEEALRELVLKGSISVSVCDKVFRRKQFDEIRFPEKEICEDLLALPRLIGGTCAVVHVGIPLYHYCQEGISITRSSYSPQKRIILQHLDNIESYLKAEYENLLPCFDVLQADYCQWMLFLLLDNPKVRREYRDDYEAFYERFRKYFPRSMRMWKMDIDMLLKGILIYFGIYYYLHELKRKVWK